MITIYVTRERYETEFGMRTGDTYNAIRTKRPVRIVEINGPVVAEDMGFGVWGGRLEDGRYAPIDILEFAERGERGLSIVSSVED